MAKGDHKRVQDMVYGQQNTLNAGQQNVDNALGSSQNQFQNNFTNASNTDPGKYNQLQNEYQSLIANPRNPSLGGPSQGFNPNMTNGSPMNYGFNDPNGGNNNTGIINPQGNGQKSNDLYAGGGQMQQFESALRDLQSQDPTAAGKMTGSQLSQYMASKGINISPFMYGNTESGNEITAPDGSKYKFRTDAGGIYNSSMDDGGGGNSSSFSGDRSLAANGLGNYPEALQKVLSGYSDFADTGGLSQQDTQDLRARAISPIRSIYSSAKANLAQGRELGGGYSPNYAAANSQMARQQSQQIGDAETNANADIASMKQSGRLAGLGGLSSIGQFGASSSLNNTLADLSARTSLLNGASGLYGTAPGATGQSGNQLNQANSNQISGQNARTNSAGTLIGGITGSAQVPGNFQSAIGNIGSAVNLAGSFVNPLSTIGSSLFKKAPSYGSSGWV